jgi:DNA-binding XRE family transcriptional regulator
MTALRTLRLAHGYVKQETFANKCHTAESHICALELGTKKPSEGLAHTIADVLGEPVRKVFPDGFAERVKRYYKQRIDAGTGYMPPAIPEQERPIALRCWKCGADRINHDEFCYQCGADYTRWQGEAHA